MKKLKHLFEANLAWAEGKKQQDPEFFSKLAEQQSPEYLWIGCSDSRVPANQITNLEPGEVFVHRNIANVVVHSDLNCLSVIQYAVDVLKVKHIIVCGHYGCGGVKAALENQQNGMIDNWLCHVKDVKRLNATKFTGLDDEQQQNLLVELNVREQVENVCNTTVVKSAWERGANLSIHGWVYSIKNGILKDLECRLSPE